jgi:hypothetical protein
VEPRQNVLQRHEHRVAHVQAARHVGGGHGQSVRFLARGRGGARLEEPFRFPPRVSAFFYCREVVPT